MPPRPRTLTRTIERWFETHQRPLPWRIAYDPYFVWVSEVMAQQTRIDVVLRYFDGFVAAFPDIRTLATASEDEVTARWSGLGYYRRARMLREGAVDVVTRFRGTIPSAVEDLLSIAGIGRYTAGAIASIAFDRHAPIVDGNVARILARLYGLEEPTGSPALMRASWLHAEELVTACESPRRFNQGLMELGALICKPSRPDCDRCPLTKECVAFTEGRTGELPVAKAKIATRALRIPLYIVFDHSGRILMRRGSGRLMAGLFHLPHGESTLLPDAALAVGRSEPVGTFRHTVTNRRIEFQVCKAELASSVSDDEMYSWIDPDQMRSVPHASYVAKALRIAARHASVAGASKKTTPE